MTERTVSVRLEALTNTYVAKMAQATAATKAFAAQGLDTAQKHKKSFDQIGIGAVALGGAMLFGFGKIIGATADFDQAMSGVGAAANASAHDLELLRESALQAGADTAFSATQAAAGQEALIKAGVSLRDVLGGGLRGALDLAAAGELEVGAAAEIAAMAMSQFNLAGKDVPHIADLLAAGAGKAQGEVHDLGMALRQSALVASQTGLSIEETTGGLASFAEAGLIGSDAGTSFKTMLQRLTPTSREAAGLMDKLGISAYDSQGQFIGLAEFAGNLRNALKDLTPEQRNSALATIFGSDAVRGANVLYRQGEDGIRRWTAAVDDQGFASEQAAKRLDNLKGDLEKLSGSFETAFIKSGTTANALLREMVQTATGVVNIYNDLPAPIQSTATVMLSLAGAAGVLGGGMLLLLPQIASTKVAMAQLGITAARVGATMSAMSPWAFLAAMAIRDLTSATDEASEGVEVAGVKMTGFRDSLGIVGKGADNAAKSTGEFSHSLRTQLGAGFGIAESAIDGVLGALERHDQALKNARGGVMDFAGMTRKEFRDFRSGAVRSLDGVSNALEALSGDANVTAREWERAFKKQIKALADYDENLAIVEKRNIPDQLLQRIVAMGTEGAGALELLADSSRKEFRRLTGFAEGARKKTDQVGDTLNSLPDVERIQFGTPGLDKALHDINDFAAAIARVPRTLDIITNVRGGANFSIPNVNRDVGGVVRGPATVSIGPIAELVHFTPISQIPMSGGTSTSIGGATINVNIPGPVYGFPNFRDQVVRAVKEAIRRP